MSGISHWQSAVISINRSALVTQPIQRAIEVVCAIERYPEFLPWVREATIVQRVDDKVRARLLLGAIGFSESVTTENRLVGTERLEMVLIDGPFRRFNGEWRFHPLGEAGCKVELVVQLEFAASYHSLMRVFAGPMDRLADKVVDAFCVRIDAQAASIDSRDGIDGPAK